VTIRVNRKGKPQDVRVTLGVLEQSAPRRVP